MDVYNNNTLTIKIFDSDFDDVRNSLSILFNKVKGTLCINDNSEILEKIVKILSTNLKNVDSIDIDTTITFIRYNVGYLNNIKANEDSTSNCMRYFLIIYLEKPLNGGKIEIYQDLALINAGTNDLLISRTLDYKSRKVLQGRKVIALFNVTVKYKQLIHKILYNNIYIDIDYNRDGKDLCYCLITVDDTYTVENNIGIIVNRSGKCLLVNKGDNIVRHTYISNNFSELCMNTILNFPEAKNIISLTNEDNKNIAWDTDKLEHSVDIWTPKNEEDYKFLSNLMMYTKSHSTTFDYYFLNGDSDPPTLFTFKVIKYYFNIPI
ncbi:IL-1 receptor antagonist [Murmansk poxvirus]|uniref:IL-1 receptor antagonist n=1 Tax=Murmansk poxvirus TaxID=2025359 RepID=A0A223FML8_9POXV|nr:IL-1 receptor antagonist [Murmansk poxvirus]AST09217.1 IL-1 receptor antagonist [Murmansk poxvirus]